VLYAGILVLTGAATNLAIVKNAVLMDFTVIAVLRQINVIPFMF